MQAGRCRRSRLPCLPASATAPTALHSPIRPPPLTLQVVHRCHPSLPAHELPAAAWVELMSGGALDAEAHPEQAAAVVAGCWAAMHHASPLVGRGEGALDWS